MATREYDHLNKEELIALLKKRDATRKLGLVWERDEIEHERVLNDDFVILEYNDDHSTGFPPFENIIIEGDNFDVLRYLHIAYKGRIKCIYIDPPYNTGNKDFIYNDRFIQKDDAYRHSMWLEFLYRRLVLARDLLSSDGVLLVSINDENRAKLELLLDQIFPSMRLGSFTWRTKDTGNDAGARFSQVHEHILVYGKKDFKFNGKPSDQSKFRNPDNDPEGIWAPRPLTKSHSFRERENTYYPIQNPKTGYWYPCDPDNVWRYATKKNIKPGQKLRAEPIEDLIDKGLIYFPPCKPKEIKFYNSKEELLSAIKNGEGPVLPKKKTPLLREDLPDLDFWVGKPIAPGRPSLKDYWKNRPEEERIAPVGSWVAGINEEVMFDYSDLDDDIEIMRSPRGGVGSDTLIEILGVKSFNHPKPVELIKHLVRQSTTNDSIVLDFFAGSGTTAQAVLELNEEDGLQRRFILVSSTEANENDLNKNLCRDVCAERVRRVINGYGKNTGVGGNFAYMKATRVKCETLLIDIQHDQIWFAVQQLHANVITPFVENDDFQILTGSSNGIDIMYIPTLNDVVLDNLVIFINASSRPLIVYSWQIGILKQHIQGHNVVFEKIPDYLIERFGRYKDL
ncbi:site-specific DNA-methyltransferase [Paenibacillus sp. NPDC056579]|uniref:site-specific DNA-methyltransferase n=1 Tax=Paenibacillus sp. NPDC056579 TaxID=3345871 RepID=UPI0036B1C9EE